MEGSLLEKCAKILENGRFSRRLLPDWGNTARAAMAGLGSMIGDSRLHGECHLICIKVSITELLIYGYPTAERYVIISTTCCSTDEQKETLIDSSAFKGDKAKA